MADVIDAWSEPRIKEARTRAEKLQQDFGNESLLAQEARNEVTAIREELAGKYQKLELTPEEMEQRFKDLRV